MVPALDRPMALAGLANTGSFSRLNASSRTSVSTSAILVNFVRAASIVNWPGPRRIFRPELPNVAVVSLGGANALVSNHLSTVGVATSPDAIRFGRNNRKGGDPPAVDDGFWFWKTVNGYPDRARSTPLICQLPKAPLRANGSV